MTPNLDSEPKISESKDGWLEYDDKIKSYGHLFRQGLCQKTLLQPQPPTELETQAIFEKNYKAFQRYTAMYEAFSKDGDEVSPDIYPNIFPNIGENKEDNKNRVVRNNGLKKYLFRQRNLSYMIKHRKLTNPDNEKENITAKCRQAIEIISRNANQAGVLQETQNTNSRPAERSYTKRQNEAIGTGTTTVKIVLEMLQTLLYMMDYKCCLCRVQCFNYKTLKIHMKACHERFIIKFEENPEKIIRISINTEFDGSYELCPIGNAALALRNTSTKNISQRDGYLIKVSNELRNMTLYFNNLWGTDLDLEEFISHTGIPNGMTDIRQYYHSQTCLPICGNEIDVDSEDDLDSDYTDWNMHRNIAQIDEFTDVNPGEKEIAKMWNLHLMRHSKMAIGECHIAIVVELFIKKHAQDIATKFLINNLVLHLCNLHSFGLVKARDLEKWIVHVRSFDVRKTENVEKDKSRNIKEDNPTVNGDDRQKVKEQNCSAVSKENAENNVVVNGLRK